jgi:hypothetical protein
LEVKNAKNKNKEFWVLGIHPWPLCPKSKTEKEILKFFKTIPTAVGKKKRNTSANSTISGSVFIQRPLPNFHFTSFRENFASSAYVIGNSQKSLSIYILIFLAIFGSE